MEKVLRVGIDPSNLIDNANTIKRIFGDIANSAATMDALIRKIGPDTSSSLSGAGKATDDFKVDWKEMTDTLNQGLSSGIKDGFDKIAESLGKIREETEKTSTGWKKFKESWRGMITDFNQGLEILQKGAAVLRTGFEIAGASAAFDDQALAFDKLAGTFGTSKDKILDAVRKASRGVVDDLTIMKASSKAMALGVAQDSDTLAGLMEVAANKAKYMGLTTTEAFEKLVLGIGRGSPLILDDLGIRIPDAMKEMMKSMTDVEKTAFLATETIRLGRDEIKSMGGVTFTTADQMAVLNTKIVNLKVALGRELIPVVLEAGSGLESLAGLVSENKELFQSLAIVIATKYIFQLGEMIIALGSAETAQKAFNLAVSMNPYAIAAGVLASYGYYIKTIADDTKKLEEDTVKMNTTLEDNANKGSLRNQKDILEQLEVQQALKQTQLARLEAYRVPQEEVDRLQQQYADLNKQQNSNPLTQDIKGRFDVNSIPSQRIQNVGQALIDATSTNERIKQTFKEVSDLNNKILETKNRFDAVNNSWYSGIGKGITQGVKDLSEELNSLLGVLNIEGKSADRFWQEWIEKTKELAKKLEDQRTAQKGLDKENTERLKNLNAVLFENAQAFGNSIAEEMDFNTMMGESGEILASAALQAGLMAGEMKQLGIFTNEAANSFDKIQESIKAEAFDNARQKITALGMAVTAAGSGNAVFRGGSNLVQGDIKPSDELKKGWDEAAKSKDAQANLQKTFATAFVDAARSDDFWGSFKQGMRSAVADAMSQKFPIFNQGGEINVGNLGINMAVGFAQEKLFGAGGVFGSRIENSTEAIGNSASINQQVEAAIASKWSVMNGVQGVSAETIAKLVSAELTMTGYSWSDSGDGLFGGKKTRTYDVVGGQEASDNLNNFKQIVAQAMAEAATREFDIAMKQIDSPSEALQMKMSDLGDMISRLGKDSSDARPYILELAQAEKDLSDKRRRNAQESKSTYESLISSNPYAKGVIAQETVDFGFFEPSQAEAYVGNRLSGQDIASGTINGIEITDIYKGIDAKLTAKSTAAQVSGEYSFGREIAGAGDDLLAVNSVLQKRAEFLSDSLTDIEDLMAAAQSKAESADSVEEKVAAWKDYENSVIAYYGVKQGVSDLEDTIAANIKADNDKKASEELSRAAKLESDAREAKSADEAALRAKEEADKAADDLFRQQRQSGLDWQAKWLSFAIANKELIGTSDEGFLSSQINTYTPGATDTSSSIAQQASMARKSGQLSLADESAKITSQGLEGQSEKFLSESIATANQRAEFFKGLMETNYAIAMDESQDFERQKAALERAQASEQEYHNAKINGLNAEGKMQDEIKRKQDELKAKQDRIIQDLLGNLLTNIGELKTTGGQEVLVISAGQPKAKDIAQKVLNAQSGLEPELREALTEFVKGL